MRVLYATYICFTLYLFYAYEILFTISESKGESDA
jgi:hypothetical protein